jgi:outer membrane murein-binding lipoprotein Lpp
MRAAIALCLLLAACSKEPTFEEEFEKQAAEIEAKADRIERDVNAQIEMLPAAIKAEKTEATVTKAEE